VLGHKEPALRKGKPLALSLCSRIKKRKRRAYDPGSKHSTFFGMPKKVHKGTFFMLAHKEPALHFLCAWAQRTCTKKGETPGTFFVLGHKEPALRKGKPLALSLCLGTKNLH